MKCYVIIVLELLCYTSSIIGFKCSVGNSCSIRADTEKIIDLSGRSTWFIGKRNVTNCDGYDYIISGKQQIQITNVKAEDLTCIILLNIRAAGTASYCSYKPNKEMEFTEECYQMILQPSDKKCNRCVSLKDHPSGKMCADGDNAETDVVMCHLYCGVIFDCFGEVHVDDLTTISPVVEPETDTKKQTSSTTITTTSISTTTVETTTATTVRTDGTTTVRTDGPTTLRTDGTTTVRTDGTTTVHNRNAPTTATLPPSTPTTTNGAKTTTEKTTSTTTQMSLSPKKEAEETLHEVGKDGTLAGKSADDVMDALVEVGQSENITESEIELFLNATSVLLEYSNTEGFNRNVELMQTVELFVVKIAQTGEIYSKKEKNLEISVIPIDKVDAKAVTIQDEEGEILIEVPKKGNILNGTLAVVMYKTMHKVLPASTVTRARNEITSRVVSVSMAGVDGVDKSSTLTLETEKNNHPRNCHYWNFSHAMWMQDGCRKADENSSHVICDCDHMTNFAVLMSYSDGTSGDNDALWFITMIGGSISISCLFLMIMIYTFLKLLHQERYLVHANLALSLLAGQLTFILGVQAVDNTDICRLVAFLLHFFFLGSFTWTAMEGIQLYLKSVRIFNQTPDLRGMFVIVGWGMPIVITGVSFAISFDDYGAGPGGLGSRGCWLNGSVRWGFIGPAIAITLFNLAIVTMVMRVLMGLKANANKTGLQKVKTGLKALVILIPLLGLTWLCGFLASVHIAFEYIFDICLPLQGVLLFICHCLLNEEVKKKMGLKRKTAQVTPSSSSTNTTMPKTNNTTLRTLTQTTNFLSPNPSTMSNDVSLIEFSPRKNGTLSSERKPVICKQVEW